MTQNIIPLNDIVFHSLSIWDENGRLFKWNGELYRAIALEQSSLYRDLFNRGIVQELVEKNLLVETQLTSWKLENYEIVLKHRSIPFVSYPSEWCNAMLKDAALLHLNLCLELDRYGLTTNDAHPWNILFEGCQPVFVDFGAINHLSMDFFQTKWKPYEEFCNFFIHPLLLMNQGHERIARWLLHDYECGVLKSDLEALTQKPLLNWPVARKAAKFIKSRVGKSKKYILATPLLKKESDGFGQEDLSATSRRTFLEQTKQEITNIILPSETNRASVSSPIFTSLSDWTTKHQVIETVLSELKPKSVLDIRSDIHQGDYAQLAASCGSQVVSFNKYAANANKLYAVAKRNNLAILPLIMNFVSPNYGFSNEYFSPVSDRFKCDLVLALDLVDWLVFEDGLRFDTIINKFSSFSKRWLLVEFIFREDLTIVTKWSEKKIKLPWYTINNFIAGLKTKFKQVITVSNTSENRVLLLCEK